MFIILFATLSESSGLTIHQLYLSYTFDTIYQWNYWKFSSLDYKHSQDLYILLLLFLLLVERQIHIHTHIFLSFPENGRYPTMTICFSVSINTTSDIIPKHRGDIDDIIQEEIKVDTVEVDLPAVSTFSMQTLFI